MRNGSLIEFNPCLFTHSFGCFLVTRFSSFLSLFIVSKEKEGSCPIPSTRCSYPPPRPKCQCDSDCKGTKKCCTPLCRQECTDPVKGNVQASCSISFPCPLLC
uniref:WAP domain-containing protein n=1 Tax=Leptobrachium leishanense TaxID=445787 RepID=A0A8C5MBB0_9ANUR